MLPLMVAALLTVTCPSNALGVRVESVARDVAVYRFVLANHSGRALIAIQYDAYRGQTRSFTGRRKNERNEPLALPGREHIFEVQLGAAADRIVVTSVLWDDGAIEGDGALAADERILDIGKALQIRRVLKLLQESASGRGPQTTRAFRAKLMALPLTGDAPRPDTARTGMQQVKEAALADLNAFERAGALGPAVTFITWVADTTASYEEWLARIAAR